MEISEIVPNALVRTDLRFLKPMKADNISDFTLAPAPGGTEVTWTMTGKTTLMSKVMGLFMNMDKMLGGSFERGLQAMKAIAEC